MEHDAFFLVAQIVVVFMTVALATTLTPSESDTYADERVDECKESLVEAASEEAFEPDIAFFVSVLGNIVSQTVAMSEVEQFTVDGHITGVGVHDETNLFLQVVEEPHVVVADEVVELDACVGEFGHLAQQADVAFGDNVAVGEPKVEDVAEEDDNGGVALHTVQKGTEFGLALAGVGACTEVCIGDEI